MSGSKGTEVQAPWETIPTALDGQRWWRLPGMVKLNFFVSVVFIGQMLNGYDDNVIAGLQALPFWHSALGDPSQSRIGLLNVAFYGVGFLTAPAATYVADRFGRKWCVRWSGFTMLVGTIIAVFAGVDSHSGYALFVVSRAICGSGLAFGLMVGPIMLQEIAHPKQRVAIGAMFNLNYAVGSFIVAWVIFGCGYIKSDWSWRAPYLIQIVPALYLAIIINFVPETPRWLMSKGREEEALAFLVKYHGNGDPKDELVLFEFEEMKQAIYEEQTRKASSWKQLLATKGNRHRIAIVILICSMQNLSGSAIVGNYYTQVLILVGITATPAQTGINGGLTMAVIAGAAVGVYIVTRVPRRRLLLTSWTALIIVNVAFVISAERFVATGSAAAGKANVAMLFLYLFVFFIPCGSLLFSYNVEVVPYSLRAASQGIWALENKALSIFNSYVNAIALGKISWKYYLVYTCILVSQLVLVYFLCVETRGYTLEEISVIFDGDASNVPNVSTETYEKSGHQNDNAKDSSSEEAV